MPCLASRLALSAGVVLLEMLLLLLLLVALLLLLLLLLVELLLLCCCLAAAGCRRARCSCTPRCQLLLLQWRARQLMLAARMISGAAREDRSAPMRVAGGLTSSLGCMAGLLLSLANDEPQLVQEHDRPKPLHTSPIHRADQRLSGPAELTQHLRRLRAHGLHPQCCSRGRVCSRTLLPPPRAAAGWGRGAQCAAPQPRGASCCWAAQH